MSSWGRVPNSPGYVLYRSAGSVNIGKVAVVCMICMEDVFAGSMCLYCLPDSLLPECGLIAGTGVARYLTVAVGSSEYPDFGRHFAGYALR